MLSIDTLCIFTKTIIYVIGVAPHGNRELQDKHTMLYLLKHTALVHISMG